MICVAELTVESNKASAIRQACSGTIGRSLLPGRSFTVGAQAIANSLGSYAMHKTSFGYGYRVHTLSYSCTMV